MKMILCICDFISERAKCADNWSAKIASITPAPGVFAEALNLVALDTWLPALTAATVLDYKEYYIPLHRALNTVLLVTK